MEQVRMGRPAIAIALILACAVFLGVGPAFAGPYGTNITIYDGLTFQNSTGTGVGQEDNETEPGMIQGQQWDLEGFFLKGQALTIVGGYNFYTGQENMKAGDIFIDVNGDAVYSPNSPSVMNTAIGYSDLANSNWKYDYVLDIDWSAGTYNLLKIGSNALLRIGEYGKDHNKPSNPWLFVSGEEKTIASGSFNTYNKESQADTGLLGGAGAFPGGNNHYVATFDLSPLTGMEILLHSTMECGNDNILGKGTPVPEPSTLLLLGGGLLGLVGLSRRNR
jgi:hypothetical protein